MRPATRPARRPRGFTLVETAVTCLIASVLLATVGTTWMAFDRASSEVIARCELAEEADLALTRLADDLRGWGATHPESRAPVVLPDQLQVVCQDRTVVYTVGNGQLVRTVEGTTEPAEVVARRVERLDARRAVDGEPLYEVALTVAIPFPTRGGGRRAIERTFTLTTVLPSSGPSP